MKKKLLFDTDVLIDYLKNYNAAVRYLEKESRHDLYISSISVAELFTGIRSLDEEETVKHFLSAFTTVELNHDIAKLAGNYMKKYRKSHKVGLADACIAATAGAMDACLITLNIKHFPMLKLKPPYKKT